MVTEPMSGASPLITPGFRDPVHQSNAVFRSVLEAMSHPGRAVECGAKLAPPAPLGPAAGAVLLALADLEAPVWLDGPVRNEPVEQFLRFHTGAPIVAEADQAAFAVVTEPDRVPSLTSLPQGSDIAPEKGCTLIVEVEDIEVGDGLTLSGPGIHGTARLNVKGLPQSFWIARWEVQARFPRGIDILFTAGRMLAALPRTTRLEL